MGLIMTRAIETFLL